jgi:hypothetical protein
MEDQYVSQAGPLNVWAENNKYIHRQTQRDRSRGHLEDATDQHSDGPRRGSRDPGKAER